MVDGVPWPRSFPSFHDHAPLVRMSFGSASGRRFTEFFQASFGGSAAGTSLIDARFRTSASPRALLKIRTSLIRPGKCSEDPSSEAPMDELAEAESGVSVATNGTESLEASVPLIKSVILSLAKSTTPATWYQAFGARF